MILSLALLLVWAVTSEGKLVARHLTALVAPGEEVEITLRGYDVQGRKLFARVTTLPGVGTLHQLSQVYSDYGYEPKRGDAFSETLPVTVSGSRNRVVYVPPANRNAPSGLWSRFTYVVTDGTEVSEEGIVWLLPPHGNLAASHFHLSAEGWSVVRNGAAAAALPGGGVRYEAYSRGSGLSRFISGTEAQVLLGTGNDAEDRSRWAFSAPQAFLGNQAGAYGGALAFTISSSAGDFTEANRLASDARLVTLVCDTCEIGRGVRLAFFASDAVPLDGAQREVRIPLQPASWRKDPRNTVQAWGPVTSCELVEVLSGLTAVYVLGDHTRRSETVAIDNFRLERGPEVPVECADVYY